MNDEASFLRALAERPGDDETRLVYADWLEERGDPRAEYVRLLGRWAAPRPVCGGDVLASTLRGQPP